VSLSTHVLDAARGRPAGGLQVTLTHADGSARTRIASGRTDADGRYRFAVDGGAGDTVLVRGTYAISFDTGGYFTATGQTGFYPEVTVTFQVTDPEAHYHVPLLLSPYAYSTYRGS
jgi:5-hydroxyisourate hydrolase